MIHEIHKIHEILKIHVHYVYFDTLLEVAL